MCTQGDAGIRFEWALNAKAFGEVDDFFWAYLEGNLNAGGVGRFDKGLCCCGEAKVAVFKVFGCPVFVVYTVGAWFIHKEGERADITGFKSGEVDNGFETRAGLAFGLGGAVVIANEDVAPSDHGFDMPCFGIEAEQGTLDVIVSVFGRCLFIR